MKDDVFDIIREFVSSREAFEQLEFLAPYFVGQDATAETIILSVRYEKLMLQLEKLLEEADRAKADFEAGDIDIDEARIEVLDALYAIRDVIGELKVLEALRSRFGMKYVKILNEYLRALGEIALDELIRQNNDLVKKVRMEEAERLGVTLTHRTESRVDIEG